MPDAKRAIIELWSAVYGEPPILNTDLDLMIAALVSALPDPGYGLPGRPGFASRRG